MNSKNEINKVCPNCGKNTLETKETIGSELIGKYKKCSECGYIIEPPKEGKSLGDLFTDKKS